MKAIALRQGSEQVELVDLAKPEPKPGEILVKTVRCGLCGTDREIIRRRIPDVPPGEDFLVLGNEDDTFSLCYGDIKKSGGEKVFFNVNRNTIFFRFSFFLKDRFM